MLTRLDAESQRRRDRRRRAERRLKIAGGRPFDPRDVPAVAAGRWWHTRNQTGFGTAGFNVPEGNGGSTFNIVQPTTANQPDLLSENGTTQFRCRKSGDAVGPTRLATSGAVAAGWTGPTYLGQWVRLPDNGGVPTGGGSVFFQHAVTTGNQLRIAQAFFVVSTSSIATGGSTTGAAFTNQLFRKTYTRTALWIWIELFFDFGLELGGVLPDNYGKLFVDFVESTTFVVTPTVTPSPLFDAAARISICGLNSAGADIANPDVMDWCATYYCNGIPTVAQRRALAGYFAPVTAATHPFLAAA